MDPILIFYADGWVVIAQENYDPKSTDAEYLTTNPSKDTWSFDNLQKNLSSKRNVPEGWFNDTFGPQLLKNAAHLSKIVAGSLDRHSGVYGIYFVDYMLSIDLELNLLGISQVAELKTADAGARKVLENVVGSVLEMQFALLADDMYQIDTIAQYGGLQWVYDERLSGTQRFHGALQEECV